MPADSKPNEIRITRVYDFPVEMVWRAWTDPAQAAQWWGPRGFTITTHSKELRVGGVWHYTMHGPDGVDYPNKTVYLEVEEQRRLVYDHGGYDDRPPLFRVTALFTPLEGGRTELDMRMAFATPEVATEMRGFIKQAGGNATWDRLAEYLEQEASGRQCFVINRSFDAPREAVFDAWSDPARLAQWLPPTGFEMSVVRSDFRAGGELFFSMSNVEGVRFFCRFAYAEVCPHSLIVYEQQFCDEHGGLARHPLAPTWPATMRTTVRLTPEASDQTRVTVVSEPSGEFTTEEQAAFVDERTGMTQGWTGSFDAVEGLLAGG